MTHSEGKHIYQEDCDRKKGWNAEVSTHLKDQWRKWKKQLRDERVPRSVATFIGEVEAVHLHLFCSCEHSSMLCSGCRKSP